MKGWLDKRLLGDNLPNWIQSIQLKLKHYISVKILDPEGGLDPKKLYFTAKVMIYLQRGLKQDPSPQMGKSLQKNVIISFKT